MSMLVPIWLMLRSGEVRDGWIPQEWVQEAQRVLKGGGGELSVMLEEKWGMPGTEPLRIKDILLRIA